MATYKMLTGATNQMIYDGRTLFRVQYADGTLGGWIENETNLCPLGRCAVLENAKVYGSSRVSDHAIVDGHAVVKDSSVSDSAWVSGHAVVTQGSRVWYNACVGGNVLLAGVSLLENEIVRDAPPVESEFFQAVTG